MPASSTRRNDALFLGGAESDSDAEMRDANTGASASALKSRSTAIDDDDEDRGEGSSRPRRRRASSNASNATSKSLALSESSLEDLERQRNAARDDFEDGDAMNARSDIASADMDPQDDPNLLASIPVYIARSIPHGTSLQVFQYPNYPAGRPLPIPTSAQERGLKESARWRSQANWVEVDLPIDMRAQVYNHETGKELGQNLENEGKTKKVKREDDETSERKSKKLEKIKLQSCEVPNTTRYLVGVMRDGALHLTNLNHVLQLRPSLHHLDANDIAEADARRRQREGGPDGAGSGDEGGAGSGRAAAKARAVTVSVKEDANSSTKSGAVGDKWEEMMLAQRKAEGEPWIPLTWLNEETPQAKKTFNAQLFAGSKTQLACTAAPADYLAKNLKSALRID